jgi:hypothetical protein
MKRLTNDRGVTLVSMLILLSALFGLTVAGLVASTSSLQVSGNYQQSAQALLAAETGVLHSVATLDGMGVVRFDDEVVDVWSSVFGTAPRTMPGHGTITYSVTPTADATDPTGKMTLTSTGFAPRNAQRRILVGLELDGAFSPGAIYLPAEAPVDPTFNGNSFLIDGQDYLYPPPASGSPLNPDGQARPGIATLSGSNAAIVDGSLNGTQRDDNVVGTGSPPSVLQASGPSIDEITGTGGIVDDILDEPGVVTNPAVHGNDVFGTVASPQITHFTSSVTLSGNVSGVGILIVDGGLTITGSLEFAGLIIVSGTTEITTVSGSAGVLGALWTTNLELTVSGQATVTYSSQALEAMNAEFGGSIMPQSVKITSWSEL